MAKETKAILRDIAEVLTALAVFDVLLWLFLTLVSGVFGAAKLEEGVGRATTCLRAQEAEEERESAEEETEALRRYVEGEGEAPEWYKPDEEMAVEWVDCWQKEESDNDSANLVGRNDIGCPDYDVESVLYGWDGHSMESWEMDVFSRIFYLEFWQPNLTLCEAGCDAMLRLWEKDGGTVYESLSRVNENGSYAYSTFPEMWDRTYDHDGLAWCKEFCQERFRNGPVWTAQYFRKGCYHDWGEWTPIPAYEIDGIYFSVGR